MSTLAERLRMQGVKQEKQEILKKNWEENMTKMKDIFNVLKTNLQQYSQQYGEEIKKNKEVRSKFNNVCNRIGIDPINCKLFYPHQKQNEASGAV